MENFHEEGRDFLGLDSSCFPLSLEEEAEDMTVARKQRSSPSLENLFSNREVLARRLKNRPDRVSLVDRNIIPAQNTSPSIYDKLTQLERKKTGDIIQKKIRVRPSRSQLVQRHILADSRADPSLLECLGKLERQRIADQLNERLQQRPGPIELIQEKILPVDSPIQHVAEQVMYNEMSPSPTDSPSILELESGITTLNCASSPSPPLSLQRNPFAEAFTSEINKKTTFNHTSTKEQLDADLIFKSISGDWVCNNSSNSVAPISLSQKENQKLVRAMTKKTRTQKPKVKKLKFHECRPADMKPASTEEVDQRYKRLLEQQTMYLRLQVMQQNAMLNALQGNSKPLAAVTEEIENVVDKERKPELPVINSLEGRKLEDMRVIELRAQLKQRGLLVSGSKARLIERLLAYEAGTASLQDFSQGHNCKDPLPTSMMQVTTYATETGQTYQVIQTIPASSNNLHEVLPADYLSHDQLQHVLQPIVAQTGIVSDKTAEPFSPTDSSHLQFQFSPSPPILYQSPPHNVTSNATCYQSSGMTYMAPNVVSPQTSMTQLSQSVPLKYPNDYIINPPSVNIPTDKCDLSLDGSFRSRASSEPFRTVDYYKCQNTMTGVKSPHDNQVIHKQLHVNCNSKELKCDGNMDDIIDIIGELSTPSPSNIDSPTFNQFHTKDESCSFNPSKTQINKFLSAQHTYKHYSSVPDIPNLLVSSPTCDHFLPSPYSSLGGSLTNLQQPSSINGSYSNLSTHSGGGLHHSFNDLHQSSSAGNIHNADSYQDLSMNSPQTTYLNIDFDHHHSPINIVEENMDLEHSVNNNNNLVGSNNSMQWINIDSNSNHTLHLQNIPTKEMMIDSSQYAHELTCLDPNLIQHNNSYASMRNQNNDENGVFNASHTDNFISLFDLENGDY